MSTLKVNTIKNADNVEVYTAKAWVNFNGTGTVAIRAAGNVSSITDLTTGHYLVNFTSAMPDANYVAVASASAPVNDGTSQAMLVTATHGTTTACQVRAMNTLTGSQTQTDITSLAVAIFR